MIIIKYNQMITKYVHLTFRCSQGAKHASVSINLSYRNYPEPKRRFGCIGTGPRKFFSFFSSESSVLCDYFTGEQSSLLTSPTPPPFVEPLVFFCISYSALFFCSVSVNPRLFPAPIPRRTNFPLPRHRGLDHILFGHRIEGLFLIYFTTI